MEVLGAHSYDTLVELKREEYHERKLKKWWVSFSCGDRALLRQLIGDATTLLHTTLNCHLLEVITSCWDLVLRYGKDIDLVPTLEEYDRFISFSTLVSTVFVPPVRTHYHKWLSNMMGFKRPVMEALTWHGSGVGGNMSFEFLHDWFHLSKCPFGYRNDFVDLDERWSFYRHRAFRVAFFGVVLFLLPSRAIGFAVLPLVSVLPHGFCFIPLYFPRLLGHCPCVERLVGVD